MASSEENKKMALHFLDLVVSGHIDEAYRKYVDMGGKHHNLFFPAGFAALQKAMTENDAKFPKKQFFPKHALADGELVAVHSHVVLKKGEPGMVVVHLFRFQDDKIVEMWDCGQPIPADLLNKDGAF